MAPPNYANTRARANWAVERTTGLPEVWALVAMHLGIVGAWQLMRVCKPARAGAKEFLRTLPELVVCVGYADVGRVSDVLRLDLATMRWTPMPALVTARYNHACCAVRGTLVVLGESTTAEGGLTSSVEILSSSEEGGAFVDLPPLSCGRIFGASAVAVDESDSAAGQVLLIGGHDGSEILSTMQLVDLATGACELQNNLLHPRVYSAAGRLADGRIVCTGGLGGDLSAVVWGAPEQGAPDAAWSWRALSGMSAERYCSCGCVMSDGRFAILGGRGDDNVPKSSCEALVVEGVAQWAPMPPMHSARAQFACGAIAGCVIVAGGRDLKSAELYDEELNRWLRLPCELPYIIDLSHVGSAGGPVRTVLVWRELQT
jgi:hypothetical protein